MQEWESHPIQVRRNIIRTGVFKHHQYVRKFYLTYLLEGESSEVSSSDENSPSVVEIVENTCKRRREMLQPLVSEQSRFNNLMEKIMESVQSNCVSAEEAELARLVRIEELKNKLRLLKEQNAITAPDM